MSNPIQDEWTATGEKLSDRRWTSQSIRDWCNQTFGDAPVINKASRTVEEMKEFEEQLYVVKDDPFSRMKQDALEEEAADVVICLLHTFPGIWQAIDKKMNKNVRRSWKVLNGIGYHIE